MTLAQQYQELVDAGYTPDEARSYVVPAGDSQYSTNELINKGGFIGDPNQPGSNAFDPTLGRQTTNVLPPWMVQPAGQSDIPGYNPQSVQDLMDAYGGPLKEPTNKQEEIQMAGIAKKRELVNPNRLEDERKIAIGALEGSEQELPKSAIASIDSRYKAAIPRYISAVQAGGDPYELDASIFGPLRSETKSLALSGRHLKHDEKDPVEKSLLQEVVSAGKDVQSKKEHANAVQRGVDQIIPGTTNAPPLFKRMLAAVDMAETPQPTIIPTTTYHTNAYSEPDAFKAMARVGAAEDRYNEAIKAYQSYLSQKGIVPAGGFELRSGSKTNFPKILSVRQRQ